MATLVVLYVARATEPAPVSSRNEPSRPEPAEGSPSSSSGDIVVPDLPPVPDLASTRPERFPDVDDAFGERLVEEMRLVHEARQRLERAPEEALALLERHRARFPEGALAEAREAYAILAMTALGRPLGEIERRFGDLVADHPGTSFAPALREAIARRAAQAAGSR